MFLKKINITIVFTLLFILSSLNINAEVNFSAKLDSATLLMGNQTLIHLEIQQDATQKGVIINEPILNSDVVELTPGVELRSIVRNDTILIDAGRKQINRDYVIQSFDSGTYTIPPFEYVIGVDTFKSNPLKLTVVPIKLDSIDMATDTIKTFADIEIVKLKWTERIPNVITNYWYLWLILAILAILLIVLIYYYKSMGKTIFTKKKVIPPYELAKEKLEALKLRGLCVEGYEKEYYTSLTDILREYLAGRFNIYAQEMTTSEIESAMKNNPETTNFYASLDFVLKTADFVKFAKLLPNKEENVKSYQIVVDFVEQTKPIVVDKSSLNNSVESEKKQKNK